MAAPNFTNRTLYHGDNLAMLRGMNSGTVQLIATDPPFNKNRDFHSTPDSLAAGAGFQDRWRWDNEVHPDWLDQIKDDWPDVWLAVETAKGCHSMGMAAFMVFMAVRLAEMRRILTDNGSLYLHCDSTASHYLKMLLDTIFGADNCRGEITWRRTNAKGLAFKSYPHNHDTIFWYSKTGRFTWHRPFRAHDPEYVQKIYRYVEPETGRRYSSSDLTNPNRDRPNLTYEWNGHSRVWRWTRERMQAAHDNGLLHYTATGLARQKRYLDEMQGNPVDSIWDDIGPLPSKSKERVGYPTQKPLKLYERIIAASSNPGDWVLDPFCGCATTPIAAELLGRRWVGIDIWDQAYETVLERLGKIGFDVDHSSHLPSGRAVLYAPSAPIRTDDNETALPYLKTKIRFHEPPGPKLSRDQMFALLVEQNGIVCRGCDRRFDDPLYLELDHNTPRSDGGLNHISNRVLLCSPCNRIKSNTLTLSGLRRENRRRGRMAGQMAMAAG